jgi:putative spermidine/putrescine transport system ATP-binding protein
VVVPAVGPIPVAERAAARVGVKPGDPAAVVVRPERMKVREGRDGAGKTSAEGRREASLSGLLQGIIYLGSDRKFTVDVKGTKPVVVRVQAGSEDVGSVYGPEVAVSWNVDDAAVVTDTTPD